MRELGRAVAVGEMELKVGAEEVEGAFDERAGHIDEVAEAFAFIKADHLAELLQKGLISLARWK